jgi:hypothetical protein
VFYLTTGCVTEVNDVYVVCLHSCKRNNKNKCIIIFNTHCRFEGLVRVAVVTLNQSEKVEPLCDKFEIDVV